MVKSVLGYDDPKTRAPYLHPEFDNFHFLELDQIQLLNDSIDRNKRTTVGHRRTIVKSSPEYQ